MTFTESTQCIYRTTKLNTVNYTLQRRVNITNLHHYKRMNFQADKNEFLDFSTRSDLTRRNLQKS